MTTNIVKILYRNMFKLLKKKKDYANIVTLQVCTRKNMYIKDKKLIDKHIQNMIDKTVFYNKINNKKINNTH